MKHSIEHILLNFYKEGMMEYMEAHPEQYDELVKLALAGKDRLNCRAAWLLWSCTEEQDSRLENYIELFINEIPKVKDGHKRDLINTLSKLDLEDEQEGKVFDLCAEIWCKLDQIPSVRYVAFKYLIKVASKYPEILGEIKALTHDQYLESLSSGVQRSVRKMISKVAKT